jgi:epoxyqueuosine reductase
MACSPIVPLPDQNLRAVLSVPGSSSLISWSLPDLPVLSDPRRRYPWARSVASFAMAYPGRPARPSGHCRLAEVEALLAFDWYGALKEKLRRIRNALRSNFPGLQMQIFVEGRIWEKAWAQRSGLGWRGKNTLLFHPRWGSRILLGEILLGFPLEPTGQTLVGRCGNCRLCLNVCPTGAIEEPFRLNGRRCLDYWTLQTDQDLPPDVQKSMGLRLFGCDLCQEICPRNQQAETVQVVDAPPGPGYLLPIEELAALDDEGFRSQFPGRVFRTLPFARFRRNLEAVQRNFSRLPSGMR